MAMASTESLEEMLITQIPIKIFRELCVHLDEQNAWENLVTLMKLRVSDIVKIRSKYVQNQSPSEEMLRIYGIKYNQRIKSLFILLSRCEPPQYTAMNMLKNFIAQKYHKLMQINRPAIRNNEQPKSQQVSRSINERFKINYQELVEATENWNEKNILGSGGFGIVYRGYWKCTEVAIKVLTRKRNCGENITKMLIEQSLNELSYLNSIRHDNILAIYGYCFAKGQKPCLVYEYMPGGSLEDRLFPKIKDSQELKRSPKNSLTLKQRFQICLGTARGINFLHTQTPDRPLIHGDIKPGNILLDNNLKAKIGDFGLSKEGPNGLRVAVNVELAWGTEYYLPPEYCQHKKLSTQIDTYSFGVTLLETFTGQRVVLKTRKQSLIDYVATHINDSDNLIDQNLDIRSVTDIKLCTDICNLGLQCTNANPQGRPVMEDVIKKLKSFYSIRGN